jgi:hypothetical protein
VEAGEDKEDEEDETGVATAVLLGGFDDAECDRRREVLPPPPPLLAATALLDCVGRAADSRISSFRPLLLQKAKVASGDAVSTGGAATTTVCGAKVSTRQAYSRYSGSQRVARNKERAVVGAAVGDDVPPFP